MSQVLVELDLPSDWRQFRLPPALENRLQELLDRQDEEGKLSRAERREAKALTELVDMLSLMRLRASALLDGTTNGKPHSSRDLARSPHASRRRVRVLPVAPGLAGSDIPRRPHPATIRRRCDHRGESSARLCHVLFAQGRSPICAIPRQVVVCRYIIPVVTSGKTTSDSLAVGGYLAELPLGVRLSQLWV